VAERSTEIILAIGADVLAAAELYAERTGRRVERANDVESWRGPRPAVVVAPRSALHPLALECLYDPDLDGAAPGLVWGTGDQLVQRVLLCAAAVQSPVRAGVTFVNPDAPMGMRKDGARTMAGNQAPAPELRELFTQNVGVLAIVTHSDGVDGGLGAHLLCPMDQPPAHADRDRAPRCVTTGTCHRLRRPVAEVVGSRDVVHPDELAARILVWGGCFGMMAPDGPVDPAWGLSDRLLASPRIGVVVTAWEAAFVLPPLVLALVGMLEAGLAVGDAVARLNASPLARARRFRLCILGDPRVRHGAEGTIAVPPPIRPPPAPAVETRDDDLEQLAYLRYLYGITAPSDPNMPAALKEGWARAQRAVQDAELAWLQGRAREAEPMLQRAVLEDLAARGPLQYHGWIRSAHVEAEPHAPPCPACRHPHHRLTRFRATFRAGAVPPRRVSFCPACSVVEDVPIDSDLALGLRGDSFELAGTRPTDRWSAALVLVEQGQVARHTYAWPAADDGRPAFRFTPPEPLPPGPFDAVLVLMHRTRLATIVQKTRAATAGG
jgi:hypothetical protein